MSLILHSYRRCPFAIRVRMVLEEKKIPYSVREENISEPSAELLALHPECKVPLLVHEQVGNQFAIFQSSIITEYLDETFSSSPVLMPRTPQGRAQVRLWTYWCDTLFKPDLDSYKYKFSSLEKASAEELVARLHRHLAHWNLELEGKSFLLGSGLTLADIHLFPFARQFMAIKQRLPGIEKYTALAEWLARMVARPAFGKVMDKR